MELTTLQSMSRYPAYNPGVCPGTILPELAHRVGMSALLARRPDTSLAAESGLSRQTVSSLGREVASSWERYAIGGGRLGSAHSVHIDRAQLVRATVGLRAESSASLRDLMKAHEHFYHLDVSFGFVQGVVAKAEVAAREALADVNLSGIQWITLDELFVHGNPILVGMDLDSSYVFCLQASEKRDGASWQGELEKGKERGLAPEGMVSDSGKGLLAGARAAFPELKFNSDNFHCKQACLRCLGHLERRAWSSLEKAETAERRRLSPKSRDTAASLGQKARRADENAEQAMLCMTKLRR